MSKGLSAEEMVDLIEVEQARRQQRAYGTLKAVCLAALDDMIKSGEFTTEVELTDEDMPALTSITQELRALNYRFRFIEIQNNSGETIKNKLFISIEHAR